MTTELPETLKQYAGLFSKGLVIELAPEIAKGILVEIFRARRVSVKKIVSYVQEKKPLLDDISQEELEILRKMAEQVPNLDWLDSQWIVNAIKADFPAVASLFLGWKRASNWLDKQVKLLKKRILE